mgnify:CR=1 FL=1
MPAAKQHPIELTIGEMIRRTRRNRDMNQELAARELKVNQSTVAKWERGDRPRPEKLGAIAKFVGMPLPQLLQLYHGTKDPGYAASLDEINGRLSHLQEQVASIPALVARIERLEAQLTPQRRTPSGAAARTSRQPRAASPQKRATSRR